MKREEIYKSLLEILKNSLENPIDFTKIDETTKVYPDLLSNSITMMYVALAIEDLRAMLFEDRMPKKLKDRCCDFVELENECNNYRP